MSTPTNDELAEALRELYNNTRRSSFSKQHLEDLAKNGFDNEIKREAKRLLKARALLARHDAHKDRP